MILNTLSMCEGVSFKSLVLGAYLVWRLPLASRAGAEVRNERTRARMRQSKKKLSRSRSLSAIAIEVIEPILPSRG